MNQDLLAPRTFARVPADQPPLLLVVIDTEEEFEWGRGFLREKTSVQAMAGIPAFQALFDEYGITPVWVVDHPIATQSEGYAALKESKEAGRAVIGTHLHPWVNPPFGEPALEAESYPGNLPAELEAAKLRELTDAIAATFGDRPTIYKAGRYGIGENTQRTLEELGYEFDLSVCPRIDLDAEDGGPDFLDFPPEPYWFGESRRLLEIPVTCGFVGWLARWGASLKRLAVSRFGRVAKVQAILSRLGALDRLRLSPEGMGSEAHQRLTRALLDRGVRVFTFSFHSPSMSPGYTPYVRDRAELDAFLDCCRRYFDFFLGELGGIPETPHGLRDKLS